MPHEPLSRRDFTKGCTLGVFLAGSPETSGQQDDDSNQKTPAAKAEKPPTAEDETDDDETELLTRIIRQRYPNEHLTEEVMAAIRRELAVDRYRGRQLSAFPLGNADEPAFLFAAYRADPQAGGKDDGHANP